MATPADTAANANPLIAALRSSTGPMTNNPGVSFYEFDYNGIPLGPRSRTPGTANNPEVLTLPDAPVTPTTPTAPEVIDQPVQVDPPVVDIPAPDLDPVPEDEPAVEPEVIPVPDPVGPVVTPIVPVTPEPEDEKVGTVTIEDFTPIDDPIEEILDDMDWGDTDVSEDVVDLGGGNGEGENDDLIELGGGEGDKIGTVTIEDFTPESPAVVRTNDSPVIRDIISEQMPEDDKVGTVTIEPVDNVDVTTIDQGDNDPFGWDRWEDPNNEIDYPVIEAADNDPFGWDQWEDPEDTPTTPTEQEIEEILDEMDWLMGSNNDFFLGDAFIGGGMSFDEELDQLLELASN